MAKKKKVEEEKVVREPIAKTEEILNVERKLVALYSLQQIDSKIDKIKDVRGSLPLEVQDLEDEIAGLETRISNFKLENLSLNKQITDKELQIKESSVLIEKYKKQLNNVKNNREYDSLTKEVEFQELEKQLAEKRIGEYRMKLEAIAEEVEDVRQRLDERKDDLEAKKSELEEIIQETEKEEKILEEKLAENKEKIEERFLTAYHRIRERERNGLAVVPIVGGACGGCHNKIPPQHELDIRMHKKVIVCEYCGRILVDDEIGAMVKENLDIKED